MKSKLGLAILLLLCIKMHGQEPLTEFVILLEQPTTLSIEKFIEKYEAGALFLEKHLDRGQLEKYVKGEQIFLDTFYDSISSSYRVTDMYLISDTTFSIMDNEYYYEKIDWNAVRGDIVSLHILDKMSEKSMNIFVRLMDHLSDGDAILLEDFTFKSGNFFFDFCSSKNKYKSEHSPNMFDRGIYSFRERISLKHFGKHKVTIAKINKIIKKYNCR